MAIPDPQEWERRDRIDRLLSRASYHRMRGDIDRLEEVCREILDLDPSNPLAREWAADILHERGKLEEAAAAYKAILLSADEGPGLPPNVKDSVETKFARVTLEIAEREREEALAREMIESPRRFARPDRSPVISLLLSIIAPGFGHLYLGELIKGAVILGVFIFCCTIMALASGTRELIRQFLILITMGYGMQVEAPREPIGLAAVLFSSILVFTYIYAVIDAPMIASKAAIAHRSGQQSPPRPGKSTPALDELSKSAGENGAAAESPDSAQVRDLEDGKS